MASFLISRFISPTTSSRLLLPRCTSLLSTTTTTTTITTSLTTTSPPSSLAAGALRRLQRVTLQATPSTPFSTSAPRPTTLMQVLRGARKGKKARRAVSPQVSGRSQLKGVCTKVGITKPKKPNSGERKTARVRLSNGRSITAYIPGEGHNVQQHSVVLVRGGRAQDCPGVKYRMVRGANDLGGVGNRISSRSKYGTKKPKAAPV